MSVQRHFFSGEKKASINEVLARAAAHAWPPARPASIRQILFEDQEIYEEIEGILA